MESTKKSLIMSVASMLLCVLMLVGTSFAWFTDAVKSGTNTIQSGNLDVEMYYADGTKDPATVEEWTNAQDAMIFNCDKWEPGYTDVKHIKIANEGTLAFKYMLEIVADATADEDFELAKALDVYAYDTATKVNREDISSMTRIGTLWDILKKNITPDLSGKLMPKGTEGKDSEHAVTIAVKMQENADNKYQGLSIGNGFTVVVKAAQYDYENDSFDNKYDQGTVYPDVVIPKTHVVKPTEDTAEAIQNKMKSAINEAESGDVILLPESKKIITIPEAANNKDVIISGAGIGKTFIKHNTAEGHQDADLSLRNLTLVGGTADYIGFQHTASEVYNNCKFTGKSFFYAKKVVCKNCTFEQDAYDYCFWVYGCENIVFESCTFNTVGKAAKVYNEGSSGTSNVTFKNCTFNTSDKERNKPAIAVDSRGIDYYINCINCTAADFANGTSVEDDAMASWYNMRMNSALAEHRRLVGCEQKIGNIHVTINGVEY